LFCDTSKLTVWKIISENEKLRKLLCILFSTVGNNGIENEVQVLRDNVENC
jgi:hypothetical protein